MKYNSDKIDKIFRRLYFGSVIAIFAVLIYCAGVAFIASRGEFGGALLGVYLGMVIMVVPFLAILAGLSVWGLIRYRRHRAKYIFSLLISVIWLVWSIMAYQNLVLP